MSTRWYASDVVYVTAFRFLYLYIFLIVILFHFLISSHLPFSLLMITVSLISGWFERRHDYNGHLGL